MKKNRHFKIISGIFALLLTIITCLYSIYANVLADKDNNDNFLSYPISNIKLINNGFTQYLSIDTSNVKATDSIKYIFIIDRTLSTEDTLDSINKNTLLSNIIRNSDSSYSEIIKNQFAISDILLHNMLFSLKQKDSTATCNVIIYNGTPTKGKESCEIPNLSIVNGNSIKEILKNYIDTLKSQSCKKDPDWRKHRKTDFTEIFKIANKYSDTKKKYVINIISDFEHEDVAGLGLTSLESEIKEYTENNPQNTLQLIQLKGYTKRNEKAIYETNSLINKYTTFITFNRFTQNVIINNIDALCSFIVQISKEDTTQKLNFYYPLTYGKFQKTTISKLIFAKLRPKDKDTLLLLRLKQESLSEGKFALNIDSLRSNKSKQLLDCPEVLKISDIDSLKPLLLTFESQGNTNNLFLEVSTPADRVRQKILIEFKEYMPLGVCYLLVALYSLFFVLLFFISWFFCLKISTCRCVSYNQRLNIISPYMIFLPILSIVVLAIYGALFLKATLNNPNLKDFDRLIPFGVWLFFIGILSAFLLVFQKAEENKNFKHCTAANRATNSTVPTNKLSGIIAVFRRIGILFFVVIFIFILTLLSSCRHRDSSYHRVGRQIPTQQTPDRESTRDKTTHNHTKSVVKMRKESGVYYVPCKINDIEMEFIFDTGASDITLSLTEAQFLYKQGKLTEEDIIGKQQYQIADGSIHEGTVVILRTVQIGGLELNDVKASIVDNMEAPLLLGQSALAAFGKISIDYNRNEITFE